MAKNHFEFHDWERAFEYWDAKPEEEKKGLMFVIDNNPFTSGYWIEPADAPVLIEDTVYRTDDEVQALKQRIIAEIELAKIEGGSPKFTT